MSIPKPAKNHGYGRFSQHQLRHIFAHPSSALLSHWCFQSLFYMHPTERRFKLGLDLGLTLMFGVALMHIVPGWQAWVFAWVIAHTLNGCCNGHMWGVLKHFYPTGQTALTFDYYRSLLITRITQQSCIAESVVIGSSASHAWTAYSDLDIRLMRRAGWINGLRACWFATKERTRAFIQRFPLDLYIFDPNDQTDDSQRSL